MNFNDVRSLAREELAKRSPPSRLPQLVDLKAAEMATQVMGHPGWSLFLTHMQTLLRESQGRYETIKERLATGYHLPQDYHWLHLQATEVRGRITTLMELIEHLPALVEKAHAAQ